MLGMHGEIETEDLKVPAKYKDMVDQLVCVGTAMTDTIMNIDRALDHFRKEGHYVNKANMEEVFDTTTGQSQWNASTIGIPNPSYRDGQT